jgi:hypothetical protein
LLRDAADDNSARRIRELLELLEVLVDVMPRGRSLARGPNEQRTLDGRSERDQLARNAKGSGKSYRLSAISYRPAPQPAPLTVRYKLIVRMPRDDRCTAIADSR